MSAFTDGLTKGAFFGTLIGAVAGAAMGFAGAGVPGMAYVGAMSGLQGMIGGALVGGFVAQAVENKRVRALAEAEKTVAPIIQKGAGRDADIPQITQEELSALRQAQENIAAQPFAQGVDQSRMAGAGIPGKG